jgi:hypothetical protein
MAAMSGTAPSMSFFMSYRFLCCIDGGLGALVFSERKRFGALYVAHLLACRGTQTRCLADRGPARRCRRGPASSESIDLIPGASLLVFDFDDLAGRGNCTRRRRDKRDV